jgi:predicted nucleotide-binding protein
MDVETAKRLCAEQGLTIIAETDLNTGAGVQLRTAEGPILSIYKSGKCVPGGKRQELLKPILDLDDGRVASLSAPGVTRPAATRKVFVVYGHDEPAKTALEAMLRRWGLEPLIFDQLTSGGQTIIEKLETVRREANFAVVLATPDDEGHRKCHPEEKAYRARQNVVLELGMMLAVLGRERVAVVIKTDVAMERPSDIQGIIYVSFKDNLNEAALTLAKEINDHIPIDLSRV